MRGALMVGLAGCVSDAPPVSNDASMDTSGFDATGGDAADASDGDAPGPLCDPTKPFGPPALVSGVNSSSFSETDGTLLPDELTMYFASEETGMYDIYVATRSTDMPFTSMLLGGMTLNSPEMDFRTSVSRDGKLLYFTSDRGGNRGLYLSQLVNGNPAQPMALMGLSSPGYDTDPFVASDGTLYFARHADDAGALELDLYVAARNVGPSDFKSPTPLGSINTTSLEGSPVVSKDGLTLYFASNRPDVNAKGLVEVQSATIVGEPRRSVRRRCVELGDVLRSRERPLDGAVTSTSGRCACGSGTRCVASGVHGAEWSSSSCHGPRASHGSPTTSRSRWRTSRSGRTRRR